MILLSTFSIEAIFTADPKAIPRLIKLITISTSRPHFSGLTRPVLVIYLIQFLKITFESILETLNLIILLCENYISFKSTKDLSY